MNLKFIIYLFYFRSAAFYFIPQCPYIPCVSCTSVNSKLIIFWQAYSFFIPLVFLIVFTIILIIRVNSHRTQSQRHQQVNNNRPSKKITIQLCIYVLWSFVYYCPPAAYNLFTSIDPKRYSSPVMKSISTIIGVLGIQVYPILTYVMYWGHKQNGRRIQPT
jgi:hypothetical protein